MIPYLSDNLLIGKEYSKMGWNTNGCFEVNINKVKIDKKYLIGEEGQGIEIALNALKNG